MLLHGVLVGHLSRRPGGSQVIWEVAPDYWRLFGRPVLGQVFEERGRAHWASSVRLPEWFSNLLPEGLLRQTVADELGVGPEQELELLARLGTDLPGAVVVEPTDQSTIQTVPGGQGGTDQQDQDIRFSLAGVQLEFSGVRGTDRLTLPAKGETGDVIVKLPDERYPAVRAHELTISEWARCAGIAVPAVELVAAERVAEVPGFCADVAATSRSS